VAEKAPETNRFEQITTPGWFGKIRYYDCECRELHPYSSEACERFAGAATVGKFRDQGQLLRLSPGDRRVAGHDGVQ
jgi:hypothetical protein